MMMKKIFVLGLFCVLSVFLVGCTQQPVNKENEKLVALQKEIKQADKLLGVAYLGWFEGEAQEAIEVAINTDYLSDLTFLSEITNYGENEGYRMYCLVPVDDRVKICVSTCEFDDEFMPYAGNTVVSLNKPFFVRGNMSDTIPNLYVEATKGDQKVEFTLSQSGMDGKVVNSEGLFYDFTPYDLMDEFND